MVLPEINALISAPVISAARADAIRPATPAVTTIPHAIKRMILSSLKEDAADGAIVSDGIPPRHVPEAFLPQNFYFGPGDAALRRRAGRAGIRPGAHDLAKARLRAWCRRAPVSGRPRPSDERILAKVMQQRRHVAIAVARAVFDLLADLPERAAFPCHRE